MNNKERMLSIDGMKLLKKLEGFKARPYKDSAGKLTVGYGHMVVPGDGVGPTVDVISEFAATSLLHTDVGIAEKAVGDAVTSDINTHQFDALVIFTYNVGATPFRNSTLLKLINVGEMEGASHEFLRWNKVHTAQGAFVEIAGLTTRRTAERDLFITKENDNG